MIPLRSVPMNDDDDDDDDDDNDDDDGALPGTVRTDPPREQK